MWSRPDHAYGLDIYEVLSSLYCRPWGVIKGLEVGEHRGSVFMFIFESASYKLERGNSNRPFLSSFFTLIHHSILRTYYESAFVDVLDIGVGARNKYSMLNTL